MRNTYTIEEKQYWVSLYNQGRPVAWICDEFGISRSGLYKWIHLHSERKAPKTGAVISGHRLLCLEEENQKLRQENEILKKAGCGYNAPLEEKLAVVDKLYGQYSLHTLCHALGLSRGTYYNRMKSADTEKLVDKQNKEFQPIIREIFEKSKGRLGSRPIRAKMREMGYEIGVGRVSVLMQEMNLCATVPKPKGVFYHPKAKYYRNRLLRDFNPTEPNIAWVSGITYVPVSDRFYYVCVVIDLFSRRIVSCVVSSEINMEIAINAFQRAFESRNKPKGLLFHSDQGVQYTAYPFRKLLRESNVKQSFSSPGSPHDNAVAEAFFSSFKKEETYRHKYQTQEELEASVAEYIEFYNFDRPHRKLKMMTPAKFEQNYFDAM